MRTEASKRLAWTALVLGVAACGCAGYAPTQIHFVDDGRLSLRFDAQLPTPEGAPAEDIETVFHHTPMLLERLAGDYGPWVAVYRAEHGALPWYKAKGPISVPIEKDSYFNFNYILEGYDEDLGVTYEDLRLYHGFATRYFIPTGTQRPDPRLYVVMFYDDAPIHWSWYKKFRKIIRSVRILEPGSDGPGETFVRERNYGPAMVSNRGPAADRGRS